MINAYFLNTSLNLHLIIYIELFIKRACVFFAASVSLEWIYTSAQNQSVKSRYLWKSFSNKLGSALKYKLYNACSQKYIKLLMYSTLYPLFGMRKPIQTRRQYNKSVNCKWTSERKLAKLALSFFNLCHFTKWRCGYCKTRLIIVSKNLILLPVPLSCFRSYFRDVFPFLSIMVIYILYLYLFIHLPFNKRFMFRQNESPCQEDQ